jgi:hypothetical protein
MVSQLVEAGADPDNVLEMEEVYFLPFRLFLRDFRDRQARPILYIMSTIRLFHREKRRGGRTRNLVQNSLKLTGMLSIMTLIICGFWSDEVLPGISRPETQSTHRPHRTTIMILKGFFQ